MVAAGALLLAAAPASAGKKKVKAALTCAYFAEDGTRVVLGKGKWRIEQPVQCMVVMTAMDDGTEYVASLTTVTRSGKDSASGPVHRGAVIYYADQLVPFVTTLAPDGVPRSDSDPAPAPDFVPCLDFTINAEIRDPADKVAWKSKLKVKQFCPD
jgi:hypothetical protein